MGCLPLPARLLAILSTPASSTSVSLSPLPWSESGVGTTLSLGEPAVFLSCSLFGGQGCLSGGGSSKTVPIGDSETFDVSEGLLSIRGRFVSEILGNTWTLGVVDLEVSVPALPGVGSPVTPGTVSYYSVSVFSYAHASFDVPFDGVRATTNVAFRRNESVDLGTIESELLGSLGYFDEDLPLVETFVAMDHVRIFSGVSAGSSATVVTEYNGLQQFATKIQSNVEPEGSTSVEAFVPVVVPEPSTAAALLLGLAGLGLKARRSGR